jgi:hypothetical protein
LKTFQDCAGRCDLNDMLIEDASPKKSGYTGDTVASSWEDDMVNRRASGQLLQVFTRYFREILALGKEFPTVEKPFFQIQSRKN